VAEVEYPFDRRAYLRVRAHALRAGLVARLDEYAFDFPGGAPKRAIELIKTLLEAIGQEIDQTTDERAIALICGVIRGMGTLLQHFDNAHTAQTPRGLPQMLGALMARLEPNATLVAWPQSSYNYTIRDLLAPLKQMTQSLLSKQAHQAVFANVTGPLNFVSFPRIERDNVLLHAIFGHELGHPLAKEFLASEKGTPRYSAALHRVTESLLKHYKLSTDRKGALSGTQGQMKSYVEGLRRVLILRERGLQELISDCVGVLLFGPSALFASYDILSLGELDEPPGTGTYPPRRFRLRVILRLLDAEGYTAVLESALATTEPEISSALSRYLRHLRELTARETDKSNLGIDPVVKLAYDWIEQTLPEGTVFAGTKLAPVRYDPKRITAEVPELIERLRIQVPPSEIGVPPDSKVIDWRSALVAGWACRLHMVEGPSAGTPKGIAQSETMNRLVLRAVEFTILSEEYRQFLSARSPA
jgi:hypothetical protein